MRKKPPLPETNHRQHGKPAQSQGEQATFCQQQVEGSSLFDQPKG
jgi:hypothetical protein